METTTELKPIYDKRKSFYRKATIKQENGNITLISYTTPILRIEEIETENLGTLLKMVWICNTSDNRIITTTTLRHIKEFLKQNGFKADTKKQILEDYKSEVLQ